MVIFIIIGYLILFHWYPDFFFASDGGWQGIRIIAFVDLVLGPGWQISVDGFGFLFGHQFDAAPISDQL